MTDIRDWKKSSRSTETSACVEVANTLGAVRDSKNPNGPVLTVPMAAIVAEIKAGHLDG
jgi:molybdenum cofactor biosynthesis enzyme